MLGGGKEREQWYGLGIPEIIEEMVRELRSVNTVSRPFGQYMIQIERIFDASVVKYIVTLSDITGLDVVHMGITFDLESIQKQIEDEFLRLGLQCEVETVDIRNIPAEVARLNADSVH